MVVSGASMRARVSGASMRARDGFTLIEIIIAIAIVAILAAVIAPNFIGYIQNARKSSAVSNIKMFQNAIMLYNAHTGQFPTRLKDLVSKPRDERVMKKWQGPYINQKEVPVDPWGNRYYYKVTPGGQNQYELHSFGPQGKGSPKDEWISVWDT